MQHTPGCGWQVGLAFLWLFEFSTKIPSLVFILSDNNLWNKAALGAGKANLIRFLKGHVGIAKEK